MFAGLFEDKLGNVHVWFANSEDELSVAVDARESDELMQSDGNTVKHSREYFEAQGYTVVVYV